MSTCQQWEGGQKSPKSCHRSLWMPPLVLYVSVPTPTTVVNRTFEYWLLWNTWNLVQYSCYTGTQYSTLIPYIISIKTQILPESATTMAEIQNLMGTKWDHALYFLYNVSAKMENRRAWQKLAGLGFCHCMICPELYLHFHASIILEE